MIEEIGVVQEVIEPKDKLLRLLETRTLSHSKERNRLSYTPQRITLAKHIRILTLWMQLNKGLQLINNRCNTPLKVMEQRKVELIWRASTQKLTRKQPQMDRVTVIYRIFWESMKRIILTRVTSATTLFHLKFRFLVNSTSKRMLRVEREVQSKSRKYLSSP